MGTPAAGKEQHDARIAEAEPSERLRGFRDIVREHFDMRVERYVRRLAALADLVEVTRGDVAGGRGTKGVEADDAGRGSRFERAAKARVVGGEKRVDARERAKKPGSLG